MGAHLLTPSRAARRVAPGSKQHALAPAREAAEHALHAEAAEHAPRAWHTRHTNESNRPAAQADDDARLPDVVRGKPTRVLHRDRHG